MPKKKRLKLLDNLTHEHIQFLFTHWPFWARADQLPPKDDWFIWLILGGRGAGKTRAGAEWIRSRVEGNTPHQRGACQHVALVGETLLAVREVMIEGPSGLRTIAPQNMRPDYIASRQLLVWPNGAQAHIFSSERPDNLRGPQFDVAWCDEVAKWKHDEACWDMLQFGLRLGNKPQQVITTTPRPTKLIKRFLADSSCRISRASSHANKVHLAPGFLEELLKRYGGSPLGRQEIDAELLEEVTGALWSLDIISHYRVNQTPELKRIVVAIDPPVGSGPTADACGICVAGCDKQGHAYILEDATVQGLTPAQWSQKAVQVYHRYKADRLVAEVNQGGELVKEIILRDDPNIAYKSVRALRGKLVRAEPIAAFYERGLVHHVGVHKELEQQLCQYEGCGTSSPDRLDALVWALTELMMSSHQSNNPILRQL